MLQQGSLLVSDAPLRSVPCLLTSHLPLCAAPHPRQKQLEEEKQPSSIPCVKVVTAVPGFSLFST